MQGYVFCEKHLEEHQAKQRPLKWKTQTTLLMLVSTDNKTLAMNVAPVNEDWVVLALEGPKSAGIEGILASHAHKLMGQYPTLTQAVLVAENFAREWLSGKSLNEPTCPCSDEEVKTRLQDEDDTRHHWDNQVVEPSQVKQEDLHDDQSPQCTGTLVHSEFERCPVHDR